jgi:Domain of unknown function (DUF397)
MLAIPEDSWQKSSRSSGASNCVEVAYVHGWTALRDSKDKAGPVLVFAAREWDAFIGTVAR